MFGIHYDIEKDYDRCAQPSTAVGKRMRACTAFVCTILLCCGATSRAAEPASSADKSKSAGSFAAALLREASEITQKQGPEQRYWTERVLLDIGNVQIRARDFAGAERSIRGSAYDYGRAEGIVVLAESLARDGQQERAHEVLRSLGKDHGWSQANLDDKVELQWIEHLIATGALDRAGEFILQLQTESHRADGFVKIALAYAKSGERVQAAANFGAATDAAGKVTREFDRARAMWQTAGAQLTAGETAAARVTIRKLGEQAEYKDAWAKVAALREAGVLAFKMNDREIALRLFRRGVESCEALDAVNKIEALKLIAITQARAGDIDGALQTAALISHDDSDHTRDGRREEALFAAAAAMLKAGDVERALRTALSITYYLQYRDDALEEIVGFQIRKRNLAAALSASGKIEDSSTKASEILKIATEYAKSGDRRTAADVAARIDLTCAGPLSPDGRKHQFDYRSAPTWGICYEPGFTMMSMHNSRVQAARVAAAAMTLAHALGQKSSQPYETLFKDFDNEVVRALARAHARIGNTTAALEWARRIGSDDKIASKEDFDTLWAVERRIHALVGAAEGLLDRAGGATVDLRP
ncbi:MAG: hypothetical protein ACM3NO_06195 [Deltaproteobacteria bacterium]